MYAWSLRSLACRMQYFGIQFTQMGSYTTTIRLFAVDRNLIVHVRNGYENDFTRLEQAKI